MTAANLRLRGDIVQETQEGSYMLRALLLTLVPLLWPLATQAQTQAACTFNFFSPTTPFKLPDGTPVFIIPVGTNDFGTIVGQADAARSRSDSMGQRRGRV